MCSFNTSIGLLPLILIVLSNETRLLTLEENLGLF